MIVLKEKRLEQQIDAERKARGDNTLARTLSSLIREYLAILDERRRTEAKRPADFDENFEGRRC